MSQPSSIANIRSPLSFLLVLLFFSPLLAAQTDPKPVGIIVPVTQTSTAKDADYSKEPYVAELIQEDLHFEADGKGWRELTLRIHVQSASAVREYGLLAYPFASSFETQDVAYARVRKPDGMVIETPASDVQELDSAVSRRGGSGKSIREIAAVPGVCGQRPGQRGRHTLREGDRGKC